jgi:Zn finger protein HypA/HybF involved in hydrogenase expression
MAASKVEGNCYICGKTLGKTAMKNHILKEHANNGDEECVLLKIEGSYQKDYWLLADIKKSSSLKTLDTFLRAIWMECCGHMSAFSTKGYDEIGMTHKMSIFSKGMVFSYEYDMGSTTSCIITILGETKRPAQKKVVRLLARNIPPVFTCKKCGKPAVWIDQEEMYYEDNPYYCDECTGEDNEMLISITNSPRCGECGYEGELDAYTFDIKKTTSA